MQIYIANTVLSPGGLSEPRDFRINGGKATDTVEFVRAATQTSFDRGQKSVTIEWEQSYFFSSFVAARKWLLEAHGLLPNEGDVIFYLDGTLAGQKVYMLGAQRESLVVGGRGTALEIRHQLRGPPPQSSNPPAVVPDPAAPEIPPVIQRARVTIASAAEEKAVTFSSAFAAAPFVTVSLEIPAGSGMIDVQVVKDSVTTTGFTARLGAATPNANYVLVYSAIA